MSKKERKFPKWMLGRKAAVGNAITNIVTAKAALNQPDSNVIDEDNDLTKKRRLRSNFRFETEAGNENEPKFNLEHLPMVTYDGKIHYLQDYFGIAEAFESLIKKVDAKEGEEMIGVAFDMEWTFNFKTGAEKTSLIQICLEEDECFLFHLPMLKKLPLGLSLFLNHPRVLLHGVNIKNDFRKLERDFPSIKADPLIEKCLDLGVWYNEVFNSSGRWSMERLVLQTLKLRIDKSRHVRCSKWHIVPLNENQQKYAAIDVFIAQKIYNFIAAQQKKDGANLNEFFTVYGEDLKTDDTLPQSKEISDEIEKLMQF